MMIIAGIMTFITVSKKNVENEKMLTQISLLIKIIKEMANAKKTRNLKYGKPNKT